MRNYFKALVILAFSLATFSQGQSAVNADVIIRAAEDTYLERIQNNREQHRTCAFSYVQSAVKQTKESAESIVAAAFHSCRRYETEFRQLLENGPQSVTGMQREQIVSLRMRRIREELLSKIVELR